VYTQVEEKLAKRENRNKWIGYFVFLLLCLATFFGSIGANLITNPSLTIYGWIMIVCAAVLCIISGLITLQNS
jgi:protein-S-isoprenylcysteine O-methyltransferase Ste14